MATFSLQANFVWGGYTLPSLALAGVRREWRHCFACRNALFFEAKTLWDGSVSPGPPGGHTSYFGSFSWVAACSPRGLFRQVCVLLMNSFLQLDGPFDTARELTLVEKRDSTPHCLSGRRPEKCSLVGGDARSFVPRKVIHAHCLILLASFWVTPR